MSGGKSGITSSYEILRSYNQLCTQPYILPYTGKVKVDDHPVGPVRNPDPGEKAEEAAPAAPAKITEKTAVPKSPADRLLECLNKHGIYWPDRQRFDLWYKNATKDGKISKSELKDLLGGNIDFLRRILDPSSNNYVVDITDQAWDAFIGDADGNFDEEKDSVTVNDLIDRIDGTSALGVAQGKNVWQMLESTKIIWVDKEFASDGVKGFLRESLMEGITKDMDLSDPERATLKNKVDGYLNNGDIVKLFQNTDLDKGGSYDYTKALNGDVFKYLYDIYTNTRGITNDKRRVDTMYASLALNMLIGTGFSIKSSYESQRGFFDSSAYDTINGIFDKIKSLTKKIEDLDENINAEEGKTIKDEKAIDKLKNERDENKELLETSKNFYKFACFFCKTKGNDYNKFMKDIGHEPKDKKVMTIVDCLNFFKDPKSFEAQFMNPRK